MPELPEVETTRRGIEARVTGSRITGVEIRQQNLRWPVTPGLENILHGQVIIGLSRRAKYLLFELRNGVLLVHLGMSGSLRLLDESEPFRKHDHIELTFNSGWRLRYHDPRRFGAFLWTAQPHPLLANLGVEPLQPEFSGDYLYQLSRRRKLAVKAFVMDQRIVVGVGNIYASEALFKSGIRPDRAAGRVSRERYNRLADNIRAVLLAAIEQGGTTLRDFVNSAGAPGYFQQTLEVYGRAGLPCKNCGRALGEMRIGQRSSVYCANCQR